MCFCSCVVAKWLIYGGMEGITDRQLSDLTGISRAKLKQFREELNEGVHWFKIKSNRPEKLWEVNWTPEGVKAFKDKAGLKDEEVVEAVPHNEAEGVVSRNDWVNTRVITVKVGEHSVNAMCRDAKMFRMGMLVKIRQDGDKWVVARHPRFQGKY